MKAYLYRITVERREDNKGRTVDEPTFIFMTKNHDYIGGVVEKIKFNTDFSADEATSLAVGLKLFSEVMITHKHHVIFQPLKDAFPLFMKQLKAGLTR